MKHVAVVGASGAVGERMIRLLEERRFPLASIKFLASARSAGKSVEFRGEIHPIRELSADAFAGVEIVLSSTPASVSRAVEPDRGRGRRRRRRQLERVSHGPATSRWSSPRSIPHDITKHRGIIANPNCSTIQMVVALKPLHDFARVRRIVVSTYQSVSGAGMKGIHELESQTHAQVKKPACPPRPSSRTRSSATAFPRSTTFCQADTPRKR